MGTEVKEKNKLLIVSCDNYQGFLLRFECDTKKPLTQLC